VVTGRPRKPPSRVANWITISEQILLSRQQQIAPRGGDREQITGARQAAEALFTSKPPPVSTRAVPESATPPDRSTRKPRVLPILSPAAPVRHAERETPAPNDARDSAVAVRAHPHLGQIRHDRCPGCHGLRGCRRRDRPDFAPKPDRPSVLRSQRARRGLVCAATLNRRGGRAQGLPRDRTNRTLRPKCHEWSACAKAADCSAALLTGFLATRW
jgi:hypothetical protein